MGFLKFMCDWGEQVYELNSERIKALYHIETIDNTEVSAPKSVKPVQTVTKLKTQEAQN